MAEAPCTQSCVPQGISVSITETCTISAMQVTLNQA